MKFKPRDYQIESVNACWEYWRNGGVAPLIIAQRAPENQLL